jgi:hypothetical protein
MFIQMKVFKVEKEYGSKLIDYFGKLSHFSELKKLILIIKRSGLKNCCKFTKIILSIKIVKNFIIHHLSETIPEHRKKRFSLMKRSNSCSFYSSPD